MRVCDRCGKKIEFSNWTNIQLEQYNRPKKSEKIDFETCNKCGNIIMQKVKELFLK